MEKQAAARQLRDLGLVILGVLIALAGDAWWQDREEAQRSLHHLEALQAELDANIPVLRDAIANDDETVAALASYLRAIRDEAPSDGATIGRSEISIRSGTVNALLQTGDIRLIASDSLRAGIIGLEALVTQERRTLATLDAQMWDNTRGLMLEITLQRESGLGRTERGLSPEHVTGLEVHRLLLQNRVRVLRRLMARMATLSDLLAGEIG